MKTAQHPVPRQGAYSLRTRGRLNFNEQLRFFGQSNDLPSTRTNYGLWAIVALALAVVPWALVGLAIWLLM